MSVLPKRNPMNCVSASLFVLFWVGSISTASATQPSTDFFANGVSTATVHDITQLNQIFTTGQGKYDPATMAGNNFLYPLPQNGVFGANPYNGCYNDKNQWIGPLDNDATHSCTTVMAANPNISIFKLILAYKPSCNGGCVGDPNCASPNTTCPDMSISMNCEYSQAQVGTGPFDSPVQKRECSPSTPITRHAKANSVDAPAFAGCYPGQNGTAYPNCTQCPTGTFNPFIGKNLGACTDCSSARTVANTLGGTQPATTDWFSAPNPTASPIVGSPSSADCQLKPSMADWSCKTGYTKDPLEQYCIPTNATCSLSIDVTPTNPSPSTADGSIVATYSGQSGTVSGLTITSPSNIPPSSTSGTSATFTGLVGGASPGTTYTISATDSACSQPTTVKVTLIDKTPTPSCTSCPSPSTVSGTNCVQPTTTVPGQTYDGYVCQGASGCVSQPCPNNCVVGTTSGQVSATDSTPRICDGSPLYVTWGGTCTNSGGTFTSASTTTCPSGFTNVSGTCTMACSGGGGGSTCPAGQGSIKGDGTDCTACTSGTYKANSGNFACSACPYAYITNGTSITYSSAVGSTADTACKVNYNCSSGTAQTNPASYTSSGYTGASCVASSCTLSSNTSSQTNPSPAGTSTGSFGLTISGYTAPTTITLTNPPSGYATPSYSIPGTISGPVMFNNLPGNTAPYDVTITDAKCSITTSVKLTDPATCPLALSTAPTGAYTSSGGKIIATYSGNSGAVTMSISPGGTQAPGPGANQVTFSGLAPSNFTPYTITATDTSGCSKTGGNMIYMVYVCQNLTCPLGGAETYFQDSSDINRFQSSGGIMNATAWDGTITKTCTWEKSDGTTFGSPYVVCGGNNGGGGTLCMTHTGFNVKALGEAPFWASQENVASLGAGPSCTTNGW
jgi:hypothetical protein